MLFGVLAATVCLWHCDWTTENIDCVFSNEQDDLLTKKNAKSQIFYFTWWVSKLALYRHSLDWKSSIEHDGCVIVYLARDIPAFVMYCINGESGSSLIIAL